MRPLILISNDDGLDFPGIQTLIDVARPLGDVVVVAPLHHQSGKSSAITILTPLRAFKSIDQEGYTVWQVDGTPTDCVKLAMNQLLNGRKPSLVLSGINHGYNAGVSTIYSGTIGVVLEAAARHIPAIAFSSGSIKRDIDLSPCREVVERIIRHALNNLDVMHNVCLNVNMPADCTHFEGIKLTTTAIGHWSKEYDHRIDPNGIDYYWLQGEYVSDDPDDSRTDLYWLKRGWVSVTPLHVDQTAFEAFKPVARMLDL